MGGSAAQADQAQSLAAAAPTAYDYGRRENEPLYKAPVTSVRAVAGTPQRRASPASDDTVTY